MPFQHYVFKKSDCEPREDEPLYVYLDGDGNSWIRDGFVSEDPTPIVPIALDLLGQGRSCGIYISRPCTFGLAELDPACEPRQWTVDRYSSRTIGSLSGVLDQVVSPERPIVLVGHSGGGLLASHLIRGQEAIVGLVTLAANLDLSAWTAYHGFGPEVVAATPPSPFPLGAEIVQLHVFGALDSNVPMSVALDGLDRNTRSAAILIEGVDHACCWLDEWPGLREIFQQRIEKAARSRSSSSAR
ncbi:MAG: alpha/beta fold hydrolase [Myxococcota bacterium]